MLIIMLVGLPGSGKTTFGNALGFPFLDDLTQNGGTEAIKALDPVPPILVISDFSFIFEEVREAAIRWLQKNLENVTVTCLAWNNDPETCWKNIQFRNDGRSMNKDVLYSAANNYRYHEDFDITVVNAGTQGRAEMKQDYSRLTWDELADVVHSVWLEMKNRNPIGINMYAQPFYDAVGAIFEIADAERDNPTAESGPTASSPR